MEEDLENVDLGIYKTSLHLRELREVQGIDPSIRSRLKEFIKAGEATRRGTAWTVVGVRPRVEKLTKKLKKLILRAFKPEARLPSPRQH